MHNLSVNEIYKILMNFIFYFIIGFFGAFVKDLYGTITQRDKKIRLGRIFVGAMWTSFLFLFLEATWLSKASVNVIVFLAFLSGILGFELFGRISTIDGFQRTLRKIIRLKKSIKVDLSELTDEDNDSTDDSREKNENKV